MDVFCTDGDRAAYLRLMAEHGRAAPPPDESDRLRRHVRTGRPLGPRPFIETAERLLGRRLRPPPRRPTRTTRRQV